MLLPHPSQFENLAPVPEAQPPQPISKEKSFGKKIKMAFYITLLFLVFIHSFQVLDNAQFIFTRRNNDFIIENTNMPTLKGYIVVSFIVFFCVLWIIYRG